MASQLAFYFCDANVRRDKFLRRHIGPRATDEVAIDVLATFNRVKTLSNGSLDAVREALRSLPALQVSGDGLRVCRRRPLPTHDDSDDRTVYIEPLQPCVDCTVIQGVMERCGEVAYVSTPRLPSGDLKGFGFVEYADADAALNACKPDAFEGFEGSAGITGEGRTLRVLHKRAWAAMTEAYKRALDDGRAEAHADAVGRAAADEVGEAVMRAAKEEAARRTVVKVSGIRKGVAVKAVRAEMREAFASVAPWEFVDYGISNSGDVTVGYVRMASAVGAAEAVRILTDTERSFGRAGAV